MTHGTLTMVVQLLDAGPVLGAPLQLVGFAPVGFAPVVFAVFLALPVDQPGGEGGGLALGGHGQLGLTGGASVVDFQVLEGSRAGIMKVGGIHLNHTPGLAITSGKEKHF